MDSLISAAGRALTSGDVLGALKHVGLRDDPPALALRGIAMAQLGDYSLARALLHRAGRGFGMREAVARARCVVAEAEVALAMREFGNAPTSLEDAARTLAARGDLANAAHARLIAVRRHLLLGRLDAASAVLATLDLAGAPAHQALAALATAEIALRSLRTSVARHALQDAREAAAQARIPALRAEVDEVAAALQRPAARILHAGHEQPVRLDEVETLIDQGTLLVDAVRHSLHGGGVMLPLARRPVLFALLRTLALGWPGDVERNVLIARVFSTPHSDATHRARLRVEIGRLRRLVADVADITATEQGFRLVPHRAHRVMVLAPPLEGEQAALQGLLADGIAWSTSALALATGMGQRSVQRALAALEADGHVRSVGRARAQRWVAQPLSGFTTILLLPAVLPTA